MATTKKLFPLLLGLAFSSLLGAQEALAEDKRGYHLFSPTPDNLLRDLSTDRPDTTESPYSVDAGHFQVEMSFLEYTYDHSGSDGVTTNILSVTPMNLKVGLLNNTDLQVVLDPHISERAKEREADDSETESGFGNVTLRVKRNLWGNDGGKTAFAVMPFVTLPTAHHTFGNDNVGGGIIMPFAGELTEEIGYGLMGELDFIRNQDDTRYVTDFLHTATLARGLFEDIGGFIEYAGFANLNGDEDYRGYFDCGLTYGFNENVQFDLGVNLGVTSAADDVTLFSGISLRL